MRKQLIAVLVAGILIPATSPAQQCPATSAPQGRVRFDILPPDGNDLNGYEGLATLKSVNFALNAGVSTSPYASSYSFSGEKQVWATPRFRFIGVDRPLAPIVVKAGLTIFEPGARFRFVDARNCAYAAGTDVAIRIAAGFDNYFVHEGVSGDRDKLMVGVSSLIRKMDRNVYRGSLLEGEPNTWFAEFYHSRDKHWGMPWYRNWFYYQLSGYFEDPLWHRPSPDEADPTMDYFQGSKATVLAGDGTALISPLSFRWFRPQLGGGIGYFRQDGQEFYTPHLDGWLSMTPMYSVFRRPVEPGTPGTQPGDMERMQKRLLALTVGYRCTWRQNARDDGRIPRFSAGNPVFLPGGGTLTDGRRFSADQVGRVCTVLGFTTFFIR